LHQIVRRRIISRVRRALVVLATAAVLVPASANAQTEPLAVLDGGVSGQITHWLTFGGGVDGVPVVHLEEPGLYRFMILDNSAGHNFWLTGPAPNQLVFRTVFESMELPPPDPNGPPQQFDRVLDAGIYRYQCENHAFMTGWFSVGDVVVAQAETGYGLITSDPPGVNWPTNRGAAFPEGSQVTLTAAPMNSSFTFNGWMMGCSGSGGCTVTVSGRTEVRALFGTPVAATPPASISKLAVVKNQTRRTVRVTLAVKRTADVTAQLRKGTRVVVAKTARLTVGTRLEALAVPRRAKAGFYTVRVVMRDLDGKSFALSRTVRIPR
jgi:hypothetical protein